MPLVFVFYLVVRFLCLLGFGCAVWVFVGLVDLIFQLLFDFVVY